MYSSQGKDPLYMLLFSLLTSCWLGGANASGENAMTFSDKLNVNYLDICLNIGVQHLTTLVLEWNDMISRFTVVVRIYLYYQPY